MTVITGVCDCYHRGLWLDRPRQAGKASIDTLCGYVWPSEASPSAMRKRRQRVREALPELEALGWSVVEFRRRARYDHYPAQGYRLTPGVTVTPL